MLAPGTQITIGAAETKPIQDIAVRDKVWAAGLGLDWKPAVIMMSTGIGPGPEITAIYVQTDDQNELLGAARQVVLTTKGFATMDRLSPDFELVRADGQAVRIVAVTLGKSRLGEHTLATETQPMTDPEGHLIIANGFVVGDYALSINLPRPSFELPTIPGGETV
ncbi:MAG: hypothetical protein QM608_22430 [Caulobacter sp.]